MSDFGSPATPNYTAPNGLETLGNLMSLKHKQQGLVQQQLEIQGQKQGLAGQAADVQMTQQSAQQRAGLANVDWDKHLDASGMLDTGSFAKDPEIRKAAGDQYPDLLAKANQVRQGQIENQKSLVALNQDQIGALGSIVGGLKTDEDVQKDNAAGRQKVTNAFTQYGQMYGPQAAQVADKFSPMVQHAPQGKLSGAIQALQLQAQSAAQQIATTSPQPTPVQGKEGLNFVNTNPNAPAPVGSPMGQTVTNQGLAPTEKPDYIAARTSAGARATGTAGSDIDRSNEIASLQQQSSAAIPLTRRIDELSHEIQSGNLAKKISETGNWLGFSSVNEARSQLLKDLGQVKGLATAKAGSDQRAATILEGYPTDTTPESTVHAAMDYIRGTARQNLARGKLLTQYQDEDKGLKGFQAADNILSGKTNPLMHEYLALKPEEQAGFYRRNFSTPQEAQAFKDEVNALKKHTHAFGQ